VKYYNRASKAVSTIYLIRAKHDPIKTKTTRLPNQQTERLYCITRLSKTWGSLASSIVILHRCTSVTPAAAGEHGMNLKYCTMEAK